MCKVCGMKLQIRCALCLLFLGTMVAICVGMATDRIKGKMKITILGLLVLGQKSRKCFRSFKF